MRLTLLNVRNPRKREKARPQDLPTCVQVAQAYDPNGNSSMLAYGDESLESLLNRVAQDRGRKSIFVIDPSGRLQGAVHTSDLIEWLRIRLGAGVLRSPAATTERLLRLARLARASSAAEVMQKLPRDAVIRRNDSVEDVLLSLHLADLTVLPVVDEEHRVIGDITLAAVLQHLGQRA